MKFIYPFNFTFCSVSYRFIITFRNNDIRLMTRDSHLWSGDTLRLPRRIYPCPLVCVLTQMVFCCYLLLFESPAFRDIKILILSGSNKLKKKSVKFFFRNLKCYYPRGCNLRSQQSCMANRCTIYVRLINDI